MVRTVKENEQEFIPRFGPWLFVMVSIDILKGWSYCQVLKQIKNVKASHTGNKNSTCETGRKRNSESPAVWLIVFHHYIRDYQNFPVMRKILVKTGQDMQVLKNPQCTIPVRKLQLNWLSKHMISIIQYI